MIKIPYNKPLYFGSEDIYIKKVIQNKKFSGDGPFSKACAALLEKKVGCKKAFLTPSCTASLEMALMVMDLQPGDEVIVPSYTFTSTATAVVLHQAVPVFVDSCVEDINIDPALIEAAITSKTKAIIPVHYAGVSCDMTKIMEIAKKHNLVVIEDAAHAIGANDHVDGSPIGSKGHMSAFSFHETKNISCGEGGALCINDERFLKIAEIAQEKGTNRSAFFRGEVDKYSWQGKGSSYLLNEFSAAMLLKQLELVEKINKKRMWICKTYNKALRKIASAETFSLPKNFHHFSNGHIFYLKLSSLDAAIAFRKYMIEAGVLTTAHYVPLHSSVAGKKYGREGSTMSVADDISTTLVRLPLFYDLKENEVSKICQLITSYFI